MESDAGQPRPDPKPTLRRSSLPPARSPLVAPPPTNRIRSAPVVQPPLAGRAVLLPMDAPESKRRFNRVGIALAVVIALVTIPFTYEFQKNKLAPKNAGEVKTDYEIPIERRQFKMKHLEGLTEKQATERFGPSYLARNFNMSDGAFAGPAVGLKRFYPKTLPEYEKRIKDAEVTWAYPQYLVIREEIWQFPDSYLTVWMREPRAEIDLGDNPGAVELPAAGPDDSGDWVVIDNFRVGKELVKTPPAGSPLPEKTP